MFPAFASEVPLGWAVACTGLAMFIVGLGKAGFGAGVGIVVTPLMALVVPVDTVVPVVLPSLLVGDLVSLRFHPRDYDKPLLRRLIPPALLGVALAAVALKLMESGSKQQFNNIQAIAIGSMCLTVVAMQGWRMLGGRVPSLPTGPVASTVVPLIEGFISTLSNSAGVLMTMLLLQKKLNKHFFVTTMLVAFMFINGAKGLVFVFFNRTITQETLVTIVWFLPVIPLGAWAGLWLNRRVRQGPFTAVMYSLAAVTAVRMIVKVITG